ncbi:MAG: hypothetical protein KF747_15475 [Nitrospira sp.]|nr:hypothetical protein [Nitrospira sp.]
MVKLGGQFPLLRFFALQRLKQRLQASPLSNGLRQTELCGLRFSQLLLDLRPFRPHTGLIWLKSLHRLLKGTVEYTRMQHIGQRLENFLLQSFLLGHGRITAH